MKYFKAENGIVIQVICNPREGFTGTSENVVCGMLHDSTGFTTPEPEGKTIQQQIDALENSVTTRNILDSLDGDEYAIKEVKKIRANIAILRAKL